MPTALVTGPTAGIGRGFADAFARKGFDLVLVARDEARLREVADELSAAYGVSCEILVADLAQRSDTDRVAARLADDDRPVTALVNNAGFGIRAAFLDSAIEDEQRALDVMVGAVLRLTHAAAAGDGGPRTRHRHQRQQRRGLDHGWDLLGGEGMGDRLQREPGAGARRHRVSG